MVNNWTQTNMKKITITFVAGIMLIAGTCHAQYPGEPTFHDSFSDLYLMAGYQKLYHPTGEYNVATVQAEILFSFFSSRIGLTAGPDYFSFSPCGIFLFAPRIFANTINDSRGDPEVLLPFMLIAMSAGQFRFPVTDHLEVNFGWDALKFTKLKNYQDNFYITGSLNAGLTCFIGDQFFVSGYYEFNHTHNAACHFIDWMTDGVFSFGSQPDILKGHSFGIRIGVMM